MVDALSSSTLVWAAVALVGFLLFLALGVYFSLGETIRSRRWVERPCTIALSQMNRDEKGRTYWNVVYEYEFDGRPYRGNRFEILHFITGHWGDIADLVDRFPPGRQAVCFVDPDDPETAVLSRRVRSSLWLLAVPVLVMLIGAGGIAAPFVKWPGSAPAQPAGSYQEDPFPEDLEEAQPRPGRG